MTQTIRIGRTRKSRGRDDTVTIIGFERETSGRDCVKRKPLWRRLLSLALTAATIAFILYLWPAILGGSTRLVIVSGHSMEPTYDMRDIVVARDAGNAGVGDVVVFEVPEGEAKGMLVIHRVVAVDDEGFFVTQGDNRTNPDQWQLTDEHIVGKPLVHLPNGGTVLGLIQNVWVIAALVGLVVLFVLWPDDEESDDEHESLLAVVSKQAQEPAVSLASTLDSTDAFERDASWAFIDSPAVREPVVVGSIATQAGALDLVNARTAVSEPEVTGLVAEAEVRKPIAAEIASAASVAAAVPESPHELAELWLDRELERASSTA